MNSLHRDKNGVSLLEFTVVFPLVMVIILGCIDASMLMIKWASLTRATYAGARYAVVNNPVATGINDPTTGTKAGGSCFDYKTGTATGNCTAKAASVCTGATTNGACTAGYAWSDATFTKMLTEMNKYMLFGKLDRRQVVVSYTPLGLSYAMRPVGAPMNVAVSTRCVAYDFFFLDALLGWAMPALPAGCTGIASAQGWPLSGFTTTLPSESLSTL